MSFIFEGIFAAVWTPTGRDGRLLGDALRRNIGFMRRAGTHGLFVLGSTGEFLHLSSDLRKETVDTIIATAGNLPVIVNISHTHPRCVAEFGLHARQAGAAGVAILPPWYFPMSEDDLAEFFVRSAETVQLPVVLYNFEERTGKRLTPALVQNIAQRVKVSGLKQSGGSLADLRVFAELGREFGFKVLTGADTRIPEAIAAGAAGCIGGLANVIPELLVDVYKRAIKGEDTAGISSKINRIAAIVDTLEFPNNVAAAMEARGTETGVLKTILSSKSTERYNAIRENLGKLFTELGIPRATE